MTARNPRTTYVYTRLPFSTPGRTTASTSVVPMPLRWGRRIALVRPSSFTLSPPPGEPRLTQHGRLQDVGRERRLVGVVVVRVHKENAAHVVAYVAPALRLGSAPPRDSGAAWAWLVSVKRRKRAGRLSAVAPDLARVRRAEGQQRRHVEHHLEPVVRRVHGLGARLVGWRR